MGNCGGPQNNNDNYKNNKKKINNDKQKFKKNRNNDFDSNSLDQSKRKIMKDKSFDKDSNLEKNINRDNKKKIEFENENEIKNIVFGIENSKDNKHEKEKDSKINMKKEITKNSKKKKSKGNSNFYNIDKLNKNNNVNYETNSENSEKDEREIFYFSDEDTIKKINESKGDDKEKDFILIYKNKKTEKKGIYKKSDFNSKYEFIYIYYNGKNFNFIFPKSKIKDENVRGEHIIHELKNEWYKEKIKNIFNINIENQKVSITRINNKNEFNLEIKEKKTKNKDNNDIINDDLNNQIKCKNNQNIDNNIYCDNIAVNNQINKINKNDEKVKNSILGNNEKEYEEKILDKIDNIVNDLKKDNKKLNNKNKDNLIQNNDKDNYINNVQKEKINVKIDKNTIIENSINNNNTDVNNDANDINIPQKNKILENNDINVNKLTEIGKNIIQENNINNINNNDNKNIQQNVAFLKNKIINENIRINANININRDNNILSNNIINNNSNINNYNIISEKSKQNEETFEENIINKIVYNNINNNKLIDQDKNKINNNNEEKKIDLKKGINENLNDIFNSQIIFQSFIKTNGNNISTSQNINNQIDNDNDNSNSKNNFNINKDNNKNANNNNFNDNNNIVNNMNNNIHNLIQVNIQKFFPIVGLKNVGSTCFMNATLQSLIHIPELSLYFLNEYPKDEQLLNNINSHSVTKGQLSKAYYEVVKGIEILSKQNNKNNYYKPKKFKKILGQYNNQFSKYEANDSKDLILYLLQTFHDELNYNAKNKAPNNIPQPDPTLRLNVYNHFICFYNSTNLSKISTLFYGTYENIIICSKCLTQYFSYQKFEYISFSTYNYRKNKFSIINGFEDMESKQILKGINQYHCKRCNKFVDAEIYNKIIDLPKYLILNIDYGKDKINKVNELIFEHEIDLKKYLSIYFGQNSRYRLISICTHIGKSGSTGHYITYCLNKENNIWYKFNDSSCGICDKYELKKDSPYLLLYEMIM